METKGTSVALSGAAILAFLLSPIGQKTLSPNPATPAVKQPKLQVAGEADGDSARSHRLPLNDDTGPWYALCHEFQDSDGHTDTPASDIGGEDDVRVDKEPVEIVEKHNAYEKRLSVYEHPVRSISSCIPAAVKPHLQFLLVTVPDPLRSHLDLDFDRYVEAVQRAAGYNDFDFERYWLPWRISAAGSTSNSGVSAREARLRTLRESQPGLLIFRKRGNPAENKADAWLLAFVVGETPTSGLHRLMFRNALTYVTELQSTGGADRASISIAGPNFSASYASLADELIALKPPGNQEHAFNIISPSSSSAALILNFKERLNAQPDIKYTFSALEFRTCEAIQQWRDAMRKMGYRDNRELAIIGEDQSAYGTEMAYGNDNSAKGPKPAQDEYDKVAKGVHISEYDSCWQTDSQQNHVHLAKFPMLQLQFPRDLSSLRNAAESESEFRSAADLNTPATSQLGVPLTLHQEQSSNSDSPTAFATDQSAARIDRALQDMVRRLRLQRTQAIFLTASNPLDLIYLLDYLHEELPDVRLAVFGADEFILDRPKSVDLSGTLVVTSMPLLPDYGIWLNTPSSSPDKPKRKTWLFSFLKADFSDKPRRKASQVSFPNTNSEGVFLAVSDLLRVPAIQKDSAETICASISVVGKNGFSLLAGGRDTQFPCGGPVGSGTVNLIYAGEPLAWLWTVLLILMAVAFSLYLASVGASLGWVNAAYLRRKTFALVEGSPTRDLKIFYLFALTNQLLLLEWIVCTSTLTLTPSLWQSLRPYQIFLVSWHVALFAGSLTVSLRLLFSMVARARKKELSPELLSSTGKMVLVTSSVFVAWTMAAWWRILCHGQWGPPDYAVALRSTQLADGLSPLATIIIILLAYALWALNNLHRLAMVDTRKVHLSLQQESALGALQARLQESISENIVTVRPAILIGVLVTCWIFRLWYVLRGIDTLAFDLWLVLWGFGSLLLTILVSFDRVLQVWRNLHKLLQYLDTTGLRSVFARVPRELSTMQIWRLGGLRISFLLQQRTLELMERMQVKSAARRQKAMAAAAGPSLVATGTESRTPPAPEGQVEAASPDEAQANLERTRECLNSLIAINEAGDLPPYGALDDLSNGLNLRLADAVSAMESRAQGDDADTTSDQWRLKLYLCYRLVSLIRYSMLQLRNLLTFVVYGYAALLLCVAFYPFQGRQSLSSLMAIVFGILLCGITVLFIQMDRNPILRRLEPPTSGIAESFGVLGKMLSVGGLPLLAVLASQFPAIGNFLVSWIKPLVEAAH